MTRERPKHPNAATDPPRENGQQEHEGVPHDPTEFDPLNPARRDLLGNEDQSRIIPKKGVTSAGSTGSLEPVIPDQQQPSQTDQVEREPRLHKDQVVSPGGNKPDTAMCERKGEPGMVNKDEDC